MRNVIIICVLATFAGLICGEVVPLLSCSEEEVRNCVVNEARVTPCKEAPGKPCKFKKGKEAEIEIDFTPDFVTQNATVNMYWATPIADLPFIGMETNGCKTTACPTSVGVRQKYTFKLKIETAFPVSTYDVKYKLRGDDAETQQCCFLFQIKITK